MPQHHHCCIPGCSQEVTEQQKLRGERLLYTHFHSPNPKFAKTDEERQWRENMMRIVLGYRDPKTTKILRQYHKDQVRICERHFREEDLVVFPVPQGQSGRPRKKLRPGALPCQNLPKKGGQLLPNPYAKPILNKQGRKPPSDRTSTPIIKHKTFANLLSAARRLMSTKNFGWKLETEETMLKISKPDKDGHDQQRFMIWIKEDFKIGISCYSWCLPESHSFCSYDLRTNSIQTFLKHVESWKPCKGVIVPVGIQDSDLIPHTITVRAEPFSSKTPSSRTLAHRPSDCKVVVKTEENHCSVCEERNKVLVRKWCENRIVLQKPRGQKRPSPSEVDNFMAKRLKYTVRETEYGLRAVLNDIEEVQEAPKELLEPKLNIPSKDEWMKPVLKYAELMEGCTKVFEMFWATQASKLYKSVTKQHIEKYVGQHYPKELMEFWSDIWQSGKSAYKRLVHSGMFAIPSCTHISKYIKKKLDNLESTITQVACTSTSAEECEKPSEPDLSVLGPSEAGMLHDRLLQSELPSTSAETPILVDGSPKRNQIQILLLGNNPGEQRMIPVSLVPAASAKSTSNGVRLLTIQRPLQSCAATSVSPSVSSGLELSTLQGENPATPTNVMETNSQIHFVPVGQPSQSSENIRQMSLSISQPDFSVDWGNEVVVSTDEVGEVL